MSPACGGLIHGMDELGGLLQADAEGMDRDISLMEEWTCCMLGADWVVVHDGRKTVGICKIDRPQHTAMSKLASPVMDRSSFFSGGRGWELYRPGPLFVSFHQRPDRDSIGLRLCRRLGM